MRCKRVLCFFIVGMLAACSNDSNNRVSEIKDIPTVPNLSQITLEEDAQIKKIPKTATERQKEAFENFQERSAIADYLLEKPLSDDLAIKLAYIEAKNRLVINYYIEAFLEEKLQEENLRQYYQDNQVDFSRKEYKVSQLLLKVRSASAEAEILKKAENIIAKYQQGSSLTQLQQEYATTTSLDENILLNDNNSKPYVLKAISSLKKNELSPPLKSNAGVKIFKLLEVNTQSSDFEDVKHKVEYVVKTRVKKEELARIGSLSTK